MHVDFIVAVAGSRAVAISMQPLERLFGIIAFFNRFEFI
jgi:hypothetical protein